MEEGVPNGYGRITINMPGSREISFDEIAQMTYKFYFNDEDYGSQNTAMFPVGTSLTIKIEGYVNGVLRASKTDSPFTVEAGENYRNIVISRSRDEVIPPVPATSVSYSKGTAAYGEVTVIPQGATYEQGDTVIVASSPTWGHGGVEYGNFTHWTANVDLEVTSGGSTSTIQKGNPITAGSSFTMPDSGVLLTANWNATQFSINYTTTSGSGTATGNFDATQSTVRLNAGTSFNNGGNVLTKWQENGIDFGNPNEEISVQRLLDLLSVVNTSITLTAKWEALPTFAVTFAPGDQASAQSMPSNLNTYNGGTINLTQKPTVTGYDFKGWKVTKTDGGAEITTLDENANSYTMPGEYAITLTAVWQVKTLKVKYNANAPQGSTVTGSVAETDRTYGSSFTLAQNSFSVQGYSFNGWFSAASGGQQVQGSSSTYMNNENDIDVFAQWTAIDINVTLNAGSGTGNDSSTLKFKLTDASATLPQTTTFTKAGYTLAGWSYSNTGNTANTFDDIKTAIKENTVTLTGTSKNELVLYAVWQEKDCTVTYSGGTGSSGTQAQQTISVVSKGNELPTAANTTLTKAGYTLAGWTYNNTRYDTLASLRTAIANGTITATSITLTAVWQEKDYTVTYSGGTGSSGTQAQQTISVVSKGNELPTAVNTTLTKAGYTLAGWTYNSTRYDTLASLRTAITNGTITATSIQLTAVWQQQKTGFYVVDSNGAETSQADFDTAWSNASGKTLKMYSPASITSMKTIATGDITLDLNGQTLTFNVASTDMAVIMMSGGSFTLKDSSTDASGRISIVSTIVPIVMGTATFRMEGGTITGMNCTYDESSSMPNCVVYLMSSAESMTPHFIMTGGSISGNTITSTADASGKIQGCAVQIGPWGTFEMSGNATISNNTITIQSGSGATSEGGGVFNMGTFTISGNAQITGNTAQQGGGVANSFGATFNNNGGTISGNTQDSGSDVYTATQ